MTMLDVAKLNVAYGPVQALRDLDIAVNAGEIVGLIGANGAGKTSLLRTISGLVNALSGSIRFLGEEIHSIATRKNWSGQGSRTFPRDGTYGRI